MHCKIIAGLVAALSLSAATLSAAEAASKRLCPDGTMVAESIPCPGPRLSARGPKPAAVGAQQRDVPAPRLAKRQTGEPQAAKLPFDDPWITLCLKNTKGKGEVACLYLDHVEP